MVASTDDWSSRAKAANWNENQKLFQLKSHLENTAAHVRMMPSEERVKYTSFVSTLTKRFQSLDIEELKGLEFHQLIQYKQSVEELGVVNTADEPSKKTDTANEPRTSKNWHRQAC